MHWRRAILIGCAVLGGLAALWVGARVIGDTAGDEDPSPLGWSGPLRASPGGIGGALLPEDSTVDLHAWAWDERQPDAHPRWVDIVSVRVTHRSAHVILGEMPPARDGDVLALGVTIDENGDGVAEWVLGIDNQAPIGQHRYWLTDVATGETTLEPGPPYGFPFDSWFPGEQGDADTDRPRGTFTIDVLRGVDREAVLLYAWAVLTDADGTVIAWDYAPDSAWIDLR